MNIMNVGLGVSGHFKLTVTKLDGTRRVVADWFDNLILNGGLERMGSSSSPVASHCQVGTGSTAPANTDTALAATLTNTTTVFSQSYGAATGTPYYGWGMKVFRFGIGVAAGNLAEVGVGWATTGSLFSRSLIKDLAGDPTTITILSDEILDIQYEFRVYPPSVDVTGSFVLASVTYDYVIRATAVTSQTTWGRDIALHTLSTGLTLEPIGYTTYIHEGAIGPITGSPSGAAAYRTSIAWSAYGANNYYRDVTVAADTDTANHATGIGSTNFPTSLGAFQIGFTPKLPKDNTKTFGCTLRLAWARKTLP